MELRTQNMILAPVTEADLEEIHALYSDERVWRHLPSGRFADLARTQAWLEAKLAGWERHGLGSWTARDPVDGALLGSGGCDLRGEQAPFWNLGYRFAPEAQGRGLASELSRVALREARRVRPEVAVVAYLLEHNAASAAVARKVGLELRHRGPDAGNPDPDAVRLVYASRELTEPELAATME